ncbi:hypothetical protein CIW49_11030 [Mycolicibacterium sp. P1-18]|uniref:hypothetical protein n=1 Tax=Mycolicibacterium sp. P1-18 TaxID=2024615 RepID=UPI0011F21A64|nr:hypothetical protein [Mycolicibacterium sp. P1-18]KAA0098477.1 hypothetical protein CIW49_11030 [Mycolicibacterium sp. P1-18]
MRAPSLPVVFVGAALASTAAIVGYGFSRFGSTLMPRLWTNPGSMVYFALAIVTSATLVVFLTMLAREVRRAKRPEMADYRQALKTGHVFGDVDAWTDWIRHDRRVNLWRAGAALWFFWWGVMGVVAGPSWNAWMIPMGGYCAWEYWRTRRALLAISA